MIGIKEIALRIGEEADEYADAKLQSKGEFHPDWHTVRDEYFAEALIAELAKGNEPCAFLHEWIEHHQFGDTYAGHRCAAITSDEKPFDSSDTVSPLFTFPPTAEQIAKAEQRVAEACALQVATETKFHWLDADRVAKEIRSGEWRKFVKEGE